MSIILCVFGTRIDWEILSKQISVISPDKLIAYTEEQPEINNVNSIIWEELDFKIPESSYPVWKCHVEYIKYCLEKIQKMSRHEQYKKIIYVFENTIYFDFSKKIIFSEILCDFFVDICPENSYTESVQIISDTHVKINEKVYTIKDLDFEVRKKLFKMLYNDKVCDFKNFYPDSKFFQNKKIFFVISVMNLVKTDRSVFTPEERLKQTQKQIQSIKEKVENSASILLETSSLTFSQMKKLNSDFLILYDKDPQTYFYAHEHPGKHITEAYMLTQIIPMFKNIDYSHFCKFGARYHLHKSFDEKKFFGEHLTVRRIEIGFDGIHPFSDTILYSVPKKYEKNFVNIMNRCIDVISQLSLDIERTFAVESVRENIPITNIDFLRVCCNYAGNADFNWV